MESEEGCSGTLDGRVEQLLLSSVECDRVNTNRARYLYRPTCGTRSQILEKLL